MEKRKLTKADIDKVRNIEGFPIAKDDDIITLSDPPYYTACPNPFIVEFIRENGKPFNEATDDYHMEPFAADVSEGKSDPIYNAHTYHTKVPHKAIMRYILHYTNPGDVVFDGFCGTGMTGVAAQMCGNPDPEFKAIIDKEMPYVEWGTRKAILSDLSPAATFIAYNYNMPVDLVAFEKEANRILAECEEEFGWMYETHHCINGKEQKDITGDAIVGHINFTVWSDVFICPTCSKEIVFGDVAVDKKTGSVSRIFDCPHCGSKLKKSDCSRAQETLIDTIINETITVKKEVPVIINYSVGRKRYEKVPDEHDFALIEKINNMGIPYWYPTNLMMNVGEKWGDSWRAGYHMGITRVHHFYTRRCLAYLSCLHNNIIKSGLPLLLIWFTSQLMNISKMNRYRPQVSFPYNPLSGTLYVSSIISESTPRKAYEGKIKVLSTALKKSKKSAAIVSLNSATMSLVIENSIDYVFTDPPFGSNLHYSELSFLWETWLRVITNQKSEAIINTFQRKGLLEYQSLMTQCFSEYFRVLKPGRWMTVEFHNSQSAVWNAIQESIRRAGFVIADIRTLDKQLGSFKAVNDPGAVKQDLIISAYKPKESFRDDFVSHAGSEESAWSFVHQHLENLPVAVVARGVIELIAERQAFLLFDRMVAYHVMSGVSVPLDAADFYRGLDEKFLSRDGMYFLPDQVNEYDTIRIKTDVEPVQMELVVSNERSAIAWLYQQLTKPQTYQELAPKFMQENRTIDKYETIPELSILLDDNFIQDSYGKWYIPDRSKEADIIKLREKKLVKEFEGYVATKGNLRLFRIEAIRAGFAKLWTDKNYKLIVETAERLPESVVQEDDKLLMYYDLSLGRV